MNKLTQLLKTLYDADDDCIFDPLIKGQIPTKKIPNEAMPVAFKCIGFSGNMDLIKYCISTYKFRCSRNILEGICMSGNKNTLDYALSKGLGRNNIDACLFGAAIGGHMDLIDWLIDEYDSEDWDDGLYGACLGGNIELVHLFIERGARDWIGARDYARLSLNSEEKDKILELLEEKIHD